MSDFLNSIAGAAVGAMFSGAMSAATTSQQAEYNEQAAKNSARLQLWQLSQSGQAQRMAQKQMGLNSAWNGATYMPTPSTNQQGVSPNAYSLDSVSNAINAQSNAEVADATKEKLKAEASLIKEQAGVQTATRDQILANTDLIKKELEYYDEYKRSEIRANMAVFHRVDNDLYLALQKLPYELQAMAVGIAQTNADIELKNAQVKEAVANVAETYKQIEVLGATISNLDAKTQHELAEVGVSKAEALKRFAEGTLLEWQDEVNRELGAKYTANMQRFEQFFDIFDRTVNTAMGVYQGVVGRKTISNNTNNSTVTSHSTSNAHITTKSLNKGGSRTYNVVFKKK